MPVASCIPFPFSIPCDDMLTMLACSTHWLSMHLYMLAYMFMHESCLLVCCPYFNTLKLWTFDTNLHLSPMDTTFCLPFCMCVFFLVCWLACLPSFVYLVAHHVSYHMLCLPCLSCLSTLCLFHTLFASFPSIACMLVSCLCHRMCTHGARTREARA